jgi:ribonucleoside-diphosphate reductase alpha chain
MVGSRGPIRRHLDLKTVNVAADYPYADFQDLYLQAWRSGLKGLATFGPTPCWGQS